MKWIHGIQCWKHLNSDLPHACVTESFGPPTATATVTAQSHLVLHICNWCSHKCPAKVSPCNTFQVSFDAKILHTLSSTTHSFIQHLKKNPKYWAHVQSTSSNPWQSPHKWVGYNFVPQCLPNHIQPMGRCQKKLKGDRSIDQFRNCLKNYLGKTFKIKMCCELSNASVVHPVALPNLIPAEPYYRIPEKGKI